MRKLLKRFAAAASAVVIGGVSCVTAWFSVPVSAAGAFGMLEWLEFQTLLQGIGVSGNNSDFADSVQTWIDGIGGPEMPREEYDGKWMTNYEYYNRLGWDSIIDWFDGLFSGDNSYKDVPDVGTDVSGGSGSSGLGWVKSCNGISYFGYSEMKENLTLLGVFNNSSKWMYPNVPGFGYYSFLLPNRQLNYVVYSISNSYYLGVFRDGVWQPCDSTANTLSFGKYNDGSGTLSSGDCIASLDSYKLVISKSEESKDFSKFSEFYPSWSDFQRVFSSFGVDLGKFDSKQSVFDFLNSGKSIDWKPGATGSDNFVGPVYTYPAAQELYKSTGTAAGIRLDVQTEDGVPDIQAALDGAGVKTVDDLVAGVAAGTVPMSKVFADAKVTPYVVADTATGAVVTDLGVSATAAGVKAVGLTQELAVPKDLTTAATYPIKGKTWDPEMSKYKLPLFQYFPFCLPWDIYQVLAAFSADPVAPVFDVPVGKILSGVRSADVSKAASVSAKIDFGDDNWSKVFEIIRILECAGIIVGLCLVAVYLIHGGR